jgi:dephospho-CoA kinase
VSKWAGKTIIGLTGNIGTGKSVVRRMLEHLGAFGIDADALSHRVISKNAPGYNQVIKQFGSWIVGPDGEIDRKKLGRVVFSDQEALEILEGIVHPLVNQALDYIIQRVNKRVVVIEAIKLLESDIKGMCDSIWVSFAPAETQLERLVMRRKMSDKDARQRIKSQSAQLLKMAEANVVIKNDGSVEDTWKQVVRHWKKYAPAVSLEPKEPVATVQTVSGELHIVRGNPRNSNEIAALFNQLTENKNQYTRTNIMEAFGEKAFLVLKSGEKSVGVIGWQVENLVARTTDLLLEKAIPVEKAVPLMITEMEKASRELQCEASLVFMAPELAKNEPIWTELGYERRTPQNLGVMAWQEAALDSMPNGTVLLFKKLRMDRILRPI